MAFQLTTEKKIGAVFIWYILSAAQLTAQVKYTVFLPEIDQSIPADGRPRLTVAANNKGEETIKAFFRFNFENLPLNAKIGKVTLKLYLPPANASATAFSQTISVLGDTGTAWNAGNTVGDAALQWAKAENQPRIGRFEITSKTTIADFNLKIPDWYKGSPTLVRFNKWSLVARSPEKDKRTEFYNTAGAQTEGVYTKTPKLVAAYEVGIYPFRAVWAQVFGSAQHNSYQDWGTNTTASISVGRVLPNTTGYRISGVDQTGSLAIYKNQPIIFTQSDSGSDGVFSVKQLNRNGVVIWSAPVDDVAKCWPLIDEKGRLYYFSRKGTLTVLDLEHNGALFYERPLSQSTGDNNATVTCNPTLGYDGTIYVSTTNAVYALSAYPDLMTRWKFPLSSTQRTGPVSLTADEKKACLVMVDATGNKNGRVVLLDNMDGSLLATSDYVLGRYTNDESNYNIAAPVMSGNNNVVVLNGFETGDKLFHFNIQNDALQLKQTISSSQSELADPTAPGISQPVIGKEGDVFFVLRNSLMRYGLAKQEITDSLRANESISHSAVLVTDASANIYALDPLNHSNTVFGFAYKGNGKSFSQSFVLKLNDNVANAAGPGKMIGNMRSNLVLAPDQTLYSVTLNNLLSVAPGKLMVDDLSLEGKNIKTNMVYRATNSIAMRSSELLPTTNAIIQSGGSISFQPGFGVRKGGQLLCSIGGR